MGTTEFAELMREAILALPQDMKAVLRIVEDPDLDDADRALAAGGLLHVLSASNAIPGMRGILAYVDDVIVLRLVLERLEQQAPEAMADHRTDSPELLEPLADQMEIIRGFLGERIVVLEQALDGLSTLNHQGHTATECVGDTDAGTWLYDAVHEALVDDLDFDEDEVARAVKDVSQILRPLSQRMSV